jgi:hypothetical protein
MRLNGWKTVARDGTHQIMATGTRTGGVRRSLFVDIFPDKYYHHERNFTAAKDAVNSHLTPLQDFNAATAFQDCSWGFSSTHLFRALYPSFFSYSRLLFSVLSCTRGNIRLWMRGLPRSPRLRQRRQVRATLEEGTGWGHTHGDLAHRHTVSPCL